MIPMDFISIKKEKTNKKGRCCLPFFKKLPNMPMKKVGYHNVCLK
jgi:hypothetical protein